MGIKTKTTALSAIKSEDFAATALLSLHIFTAIAILTLVRSLINALALDAYPQSFLPYLFAAQAGFYLLFSAVYSWAIGHFGARRVGALFIISFTMLVIAARGAIYFHPRWLPFFLYVTLETFSSLLIIQNWTTVSNCLDSREAKKVLPITGAAGTLGALGGGALASGIAAGFGAENILIPCLLLLVISMFSDRKLRTTAGRGFHDDQDQEEPRAVKGIAADPLLRRFIIAVILAATAFTVLDYQFKAIIQASFNKDEIARFLGGFFAASSVFTFLVQSLIEGRILRRFGMTFGLASLPMAILSGSTAFFFFPGIWAAGITIFIANTASYSLYRSARELTLMPYLPRVKQRLKIIIEGIVRPGAIMFSSGAIVLVGESVSMRELSIAAAACAASAILAAIAMKKPFTGRLELALASRRLELMDIPALASNADPVTAGIIKKALANRDRRTCLFALELIRDSGIKSVSSLVAKLFDHKDPDIRAAAVNTAGVNAGERVRALLAAEKDPQVQIACLRALRRGGTRPDFSVLIALLNAETPAVRAEATISLFRHGGIEGIITAAEATKKMLADHDPEELAWGATILGELKNEFFARDLMPLLNHENPRVRHAAITAAGRLGAPDLAGPLLIRLRRPEDTPQAAAALAAIDPPPVSTMARELMESNDLNFIKAITRTLAMIPTIDSAAPLIEAIKIPAKRLPAVKALARLRRLGVTVTPSACLEGIKDEITRNTSLAILAATPVPAGNGAVLLGDELAFRLRRSHETIFRLLGLIYNPAITHKACVNFLSGSKRLRANSLELLEHLLPRSTARMVLPFLETPGGSGDEFIPLIIKSGEPLLNAIAAWGWPEKIKKDYPETYERSKEMIPEIEKIFFLKSVPFLAELTAEQLRRVAEIFTEKNLAAGSEIFREGDPGSSMFVIANGGVKVEKKGREIARLGEKDFFGEMALLDYAERTATVTAIDDTGLLVLTTDSFTDLVMEYPEIALGVMRTLSRRLRQLMEPENEGS